MKFKKSLVSLIVVFAVAPFANAYMFQGLDVDVDYWSGIAAGQNVNETIIVVDWNAANGPYTTESHAFGYRWTGTLTVGDALDDIDGNGGFNINLTAGGYISDTNYNDGLDSHTQTGDDWTWVGQTVDAGANWIGNGGGVYAETLVDGNIEGLNINYMDWTSVNLDIPTIPEPTTIALLSIGGLLLRRRKA